MMPNEESDSYFGAIHGGVAHAYIKMPIRCNAYCHPPVHCDVQFGNADWTQEKAERVAAKDNRIAEPTRIVRVERAYEAPPPERDTYFFSPRADPHNNTAWLVFWEVI